MVVCLLAIVGIGGYLAAGGLSGDGSHGAPRQGGQSGRQQTSAQDGRETEFTPIGLSGWLRGGLDITA